MGSAKCPSAAGQGVSGKALEGAGVEAGMVGVLWVGSVGGRCGPCVGVRPNVPAHLTW